MANIKTNLAISQSKSQIWEKVLENLFSRNRFRNDSAHKSA